MPTYEYECRSCHRRFERFQPITSKPVIVCPRCKGTARRLISAGGGLLFKGKGFYITDYRSPQYKSQAEKESKPAKPESKPAKSESKPTKLESKPAASGVKSAA